MPACSMNPAQLDCPTCKGFKSYGICSHVLAINHILELIDVGHQLKALHQKSRKGGNRKQTRAAMVLQDPLLAPCRHAQPRLGMTRQKSSAEYGRIQQNTHVFSYYSSYFIRILSVFYAVFCTVFYPYSVEDTEFKRFSYSMPYSCCIRAVFLPYSIHGKN